MARVLMVFVDGLGLGEAGDFNPLVTVPTPGFRSCLSGAPLTLEQAGFREEGALLLPLEATLGVKGPPQSATGQAALLTGENGAALLGRHLKGFPNRPLRELLQEKGLFKRLKDRGHQVDFANAFRPPFFEALDRGASFFSCTTTAAYYAGLSFHTLEDAEEGQALYADITHENLREQGYPLKVISPREAAGRLARLAAAQDFTLFEYFLTDLAAHSGDPKKIQEALTRLDGFVGALVRLLPPDTLLLLTSDHGNIEDMRARGHTLNPVPALVRGPGAEHFQEMAAITDVTPALLTYLARGQSGLGGGRAVVPR